MMKALLPSGREIYTDERLRISVYVEDRRSARRIERALRKHLKDDVRYLNIDIQREEEVSSWEANIRWGDASDYHQCDRIALTPEERTPEAIIARISQELGRNGFDGKVWKSVPTSRA